MPGRSGGHERQNGSDLPLVLLQKLLSFFQLLFRNQFRTELIIAHFDDDQEVVEDIGDDEKHHAKEYDRKECAERRAQGSDLVQLVEMREARRHLQARGDGDKHGTVDGHVVLSRYVDFARSSGGLLCGEMG